MAAFDNFVITKQEVIAGERGWGIGGIALNDS